MIHAVAIEAAPAWNGAPPHFTTAYYSPADLDAAFKHWEFLHKLWGTTSRTPPSIRTGRSSRVGGNVRRTCRWSLCVQQ